LSAWRWISPPIRSTEGRQLARRDMHPVTAAGIAPASRIPFQV